MIIPSFDTIKTMKPIVDLHMHTTFSDGLKTPEELIDFAKSRGVEVMCINDHDTVKGVMHMLTMKLSDITVLCGIELSSTFEEDYSTIHVTGYFPRDTKFETLQEELSEVVTKKRIEKAKKMVDNLIKGGINITWEQVMERCHNCLPSRPRIAEVLIANQVVTTVNEAFDKYLNKKSPYYVLGGYMSTEEVVDLIHRYNGLACVAHPWLTDNPPSVMKHFYEIGVDGMECFPPPHKQDENSHIYYEFAKEHNLLVTSGSDYHGSKDPEVLPGDNIYREDEWKRVEEVFRTKKII